MIYQQNTIGAIGVEVQHPYAHVTQNFTAKKMFTRNEYPNLKNGIRQP